LTVRERNAAIEVWTVFAIEPTGSGLSIGVGSAAPIRLAAESPGGARRVWRFVRLCADVSKILLRAPDELHWNWPAFPARNGGLGTMQRFRLPGYFAQRQAVAWYPVTNEADSTATAIALTAAMRLLRARLRQQSPPALAELTMPQALALARIVEEGPISNAALAAGEYMRPQSTHEMVRLLEARGLVERRGDPTDRRKLLIEVTSSGRGVVSELIGIRHEWLAGAIERNLTAAEKQMLAVAAELMGRIAASDAGAEADELA
jgi:DNA-binding MarR family transcriptional regulator